jgi:hypothetical protein
MRVVIQLHPATELLAAVADPGTQVAAADVVGNLPGFDLENSYDPIHIPGLVPGTAGGPETFSAHPADGSVLVRGEIADDYQDVLAGLNGSSTVAGVFADPIIESVLTCGGDPAVGTWHDVENLFHTSDFASAGLTANGVALAVVDTGINADRVNQARGGGTFTIDTARSWNPQGVTGTAGQFPVDHGSMCAFDALIAAPKAAYLDIPVMRSTRKGGSTMDGLLSDAVAAYSHLRTVLSDQPDATRALVISNSWGSFSPQWDFPVGQPGNYSDNPNHPFNIIVRSLDAAGADILFAAGNCGKDCPDSRCGLTDRPICGANSSPSVLSIGGVDTNGQRVGYSSQGPGRLSDRKPDVCAYTHYLGSQVFGANDPDTGTSAACPTAAGLVAAIRTTHSATALPPAQLRALLQRTATHHDPSGFDYDYGYGTLNASAILTELQKTNAARA